MENNRGFSDWPEDWISSQDTSLRACTKSTIADCERVRSTSPSDIPRLTPDSWLLKEKTMSAETVMCVDRLSFANSSAGSRLERLESRKD
jgi:hypothetical protein